MDEIGHPFIGLMIVLPLLSAFLQWCPSLKGFELGGQDSLQIYRWNGGVALLCYVFCACIITGTIVSTCYALP